MNVQKRGYMKVNTRRVVLELLNDVEKGKYSNTLIQQLQKRDDIDDRDKKLISKIVYGVIENKLYLDYVIRKFSSIRLKKIDPDILQVLRLTAYQIMYLDKIPDSAAVNEGVKLVKKIQPRHSGFANGLLRNLARSYESVVLPEDLLDRLSVVYSHPKWLVERLVNKHGSDFTEKLLEANNETPSLVVRTNTLLINREDLMTKLQLAGLEVKKSDIVEEGIIIDALGADALDKLMLFKEGYFIVQDESSMMVGHVLNPESSDCVLDMCAAPGGKTTHLASLMGNKGQVYACDVSQNKLNLIKENVKRLGLNNVRMFLNDGTKYNEDFIEKFDKVLLDAPCSGLGIIRRKPDIKYQKTNEHIEELMNIQYDMLLQSAKYVKKGGVLVYSTCTIDERENQEMMTRFLEAHDEFVREPINGTDDLQMYPHIHHTDGFYICKLRKK